MYIGHSKHSSLMPVSYTHLLISTPTEFIIIADLPGVEKDNLSVDITNESVTITVTFPEGMEGEGINYIKRERGFGERCV